MSHSFDWVLCAIDNKSIGIDIEKIMPIDYKGLAQENFTRRGLGIHLNSFTIDIDDEDIRLILPINLYDYYFKEFNIDCEYHISVCASHLYFPEKVNILSQDKVIKRVLSNSKQ